MIVNNTKLLIVDANIAEQTGDFYQPSKVKPARAKTFDDNCKPSRQKGSFARNKKFLKDKKALFLDGLDCD